MTAHVKTGKMGSPDAYFVERTPLRRIAEPEDVSDAVWFLLSDYSRHITGVCLDVNGGYYMAT